MRRELDLDDFQAPVLSFKYFIINIA